MANQSDCAHERIEVRSSCVGCGRELGRAQVGREHFKERGLSRAEIEAQGASALPDREALSLANINLAAPINLAAALNVLSDGSIAFAGAEQTTPIDQST